MASVHEVECDQRLGVTVSLRVVAGQVHANIRTRRRTLPTLQRAVVIWILPLLEYTHGPSFSSACLPLHFLDRNWSKLHLGIVFASLSLIRIPANLLVAAFGEWVCVVLLAACALGSIPAAVFPDNLAAVIVGTLLNSMTSNPQAWRVMSSQLTPSDAQPRSLRVITLSEVIGYSIASLLGGFFYEVGGYGVCATFQLVVTSTQCVVLLAMPVVHNNFRVFIVHCRTKCLKGRSSDVTAGGGGGDPRRDGLRTSLHSLRSTRTLVPVCFCLAAGFTNSFCYVTEWVLYAIYFREAYHWRSTAIGAAQMAGDLIAGVFLLLASLKSLVPQCRVPSLLDNGAIPPPLPASSSRHRSNHAATTTSTAAGGAAAHHPGMNEEVKGATCPTTCRPLLRPPHSLSLLFALFSCCFAMLASSTFAVAVIGQIGMGTVNMPHQ